MPNTVIVTIRGGADEADFELPAKIPLAQWSDSLEQSLRQSFYGLRLEGKRVCLCWQERVIPKEATLEQCGIYDGSILMLRLEAA